ncbi:glycosyltransferase involved in cell wall biosynthesis [Pedobacter sp. CAN_A7]|uniref:XrtY-associated glycosyltransferase XYAG1 n=1 Tax=Pedobacter sp. CAN_A7 TaxID=2787722 RepID=UPI0018CBBCEB
MITILQITPSYKPAYVYGGPTRSISKLCEELLNSKFQVRVLTTTANGSNELPVETEKVLKVDKVDVQYFKRFTKDHTHFSPALLWQLIKLIKAAKQQPAHKLLIHIHSWWNIVALSALFISRCYHVPVVLSARGMLTSYTFNNRNSFYKTLIHQHIGSKLLENLAIHATTTKEASDIRSLRIKCKKIYIIPNMVNLPLLANPISISAPFTTTLQLLFLSRIEEKKGLFCLFAALSTLDLPWKLTIAGTGDIHYILQLKKLTEVLNIHQQINWLGEVNDKEKFGLYRQSDFLILPSFNENFANVVIESLAVGTPVIVSMEVGLADYIAENNMGWVTHTDPTSLKNCIQLAALDHKKRAYIKKEAPRIIRKDYAPKAILLNYIQMYEQILNHGS